MNRVDDSDVVTVRLPRAPTAVLLAVLLHGAVIFLLSLLSPPRKPDERIAITLQQKPRPETLQPTVAQPLQPSAAQPKPPPLKEKNVAPTSRSPLVPVVPSSSSPPDNRVVLPERPVPSPEAPSAGAQTAWKDHLRNALAATSPKLASGVLAPSVANLAQIAASDARLYDEQTEKKLQENHGPFFRRGIEALRGQWHPSDVLRKTDLLDPTKMCGSTTRTTYAVAVIDRSGNVIDVDVKNPSGCPALDDEAVAAFRRVAQFPNPPAGLFVKPDGSPAKTARYPVRFIVSFNGQLQLDWQ
jgi:TonB family protein